MKTAEEVLRKHIPSPNNEGEKNDDSHILKAMEEYSSQDKWIGVEDRLPTKEDADENGHVLAYVKEHEGEWMFKMTINWNQVEGVGTHWMPLPTPPTR
jgi:hypothetical protein